MKSHQRPCAQLVFVGNGDRRPDIFDMFEHENRILGCVLELLEE